MALNSLLAAAAAWLFARYAPFSRVLRACFAFSFYMAFEYGVIARSYSLGLLLLFACLILARRREERPWAYAAALGLLVQTNVPCLFLGAALLAVWIREKGLGGRKAPSAAAAASVALALWQLRAPNAVLVPRGAMPGLGGAVLALGRAFAPDPMLPLAVGLLLAAVAAGAGFLELRRSPRAAWVALGPSIALLLVFAFVRHPSARQLGFLPVSLLAALWVARASGARPDRKADLVLALCFALTFRLAARTLWLDFNRPFSGGADMAAFIASHPVGDLAAYPSANAASVLAYLPGRDVYFITEDRRGTFMRWDVGVDARLWRREDIVRALRRRFPSRLPWLLVPDKLGPAGEGLFELRHASAEGVFGYGVETFYLYEPSARR